ncbi:ATP-dependent DNA helicase RecG [Roseicyclus sp. F158]|uniref:Probable DNA 3'-5' helicase RecG n=1 Tax=Tropicimonas omnivorans TaxID=3075590 RepID=A0ABU3DK29_9RHOB|nr:ATP-dependent DNA helicase RecG [Roseicyclus sp. F158]MDT0684021.1 ATP-dependent DNA helicase RecG [Roseicyclus sp. F158]
MAEPDRGGVTGRPPELFPLFAGIDTLPGIGPKMAKALEGAAISRPRDLVLTLPQSGIDRRRVDTIRDVVPPSVVTIAVTIGRHRPSQRRGGPHRVMVEDGAGNAFDLVFFRGGGPWLEDQLPTGERRIVSGKLELFDGVAQIVHPDHIVRPEDAAKIPEFEPVYPLTAGVTQKAMSKAAAAALHRLPQGDDWIDPGVLAREGWPSFADALRMAHAPRSMAELAAEAPARRRLAYDEMLAHQVTLALARARRREKPGRATAGDGALRARVLGALPYDPTSAQARAMEEIAADMAAPRRMNRLLQGDVGSGKTLVAFAALLTAVEAGGQGVLMAPTEILARQHMESLAPLAEAAGIRLAVLTGRDRGADRARLLGDLAEGRIRILVGTHAVFQKDVVFGDLRLAVIDEQHRFGVAQRMELGAKGERMDILVMTATPIPRSLSLAQYGDMDVSVLDEKPPGRTPIVTSSVPMARLPDVVERLRGAIAEGRQAYWVCPLVEESETADLTAAEERFKRLRAAFGDDQVGLVHGRLTPAEKDAAMARFASGQTAVLVATTVIEVGVNVPNASIMVIEQAESFGLAQLHQLRGRVGRGAVASTCLLLYRAPLGETARRRLDILRQSEDGFRIAEEDLAIRGAGDLIGTAQSGMPRFRIAEPERQSGLMATAQRDARALLEIDPRLEGQRGRAIKILLWLMEQDRAIRLIDIG